MDSVLEYLSRELGVSAHQIQTVLNLLEEGATIPFIARYRKEMTGSLDEEQIRQIELQYRYQVSLQEKKESIAHLIAEKGLLNENIQKRIDACQKLAELDELYRPYKEKKKTKATAAIEAGLAPAADQIMAQKRFNSVLKIIQYYSRKTGLSEEDVRQGCEYILAQQISDDPVIRSITLREMDRFGKLKTALKKDAADEKKTYEIYYDFSSPVSRLKPHQIMAINRAEKEKILSVGFDFDQERMITNMKKRLIRNPGSDYAEILEESIRDSARRLIVPSIGRQIRRELKEKAEEQSIETFRQNLQHLLMTRPLDAQRVLGFDPAFRTGCKLAFLDETGGVLDIDVIYPHTGEKARKESDIKFRKLLERYQPKTIAIGNGTASRESEAFVSQILRDFPDIRYALVSEAGASVYSASDLAREEFPDLTVEKRSAVSIGRRIQDPLSELVKIDPKSIGVGEYQHDLPAKQLDEALEFTISKVVNQVGVNINTASSSILKYISGLNKTSITKLIAARNSHPFASRQEIADLKGISARTFEQCAGFLRIADAADPLDQTGIHPESYPLARKLIDLFNLDMTEFRTEGFNKKLDALMSKEQIAAAASRLSCDPLSVQDILKELRNPGLDPRSALDGPILKSNVLEVRDLKEGMQLQGTIRNVTSFGAFVDIGLHQDGLIHISKLADRFVSDLSEIVHTGQIVTCYVLSADPLRERVQLSLIHP